MAKYIQPLLLGLFIYLILGNWTASADTAPSKTSEIRYQRYFSREDRNYHRFLLSPTPEELIYVTRMKAEANIDDTPEKETIVLILVYMRTPSRINGWRQAYGDSWLQAFIFIAEADTDAKIPKKKDAFKFFDAGEPALDVPVAKAIELQNPSFVFTEPPEDVLKSRAATFKLVDLTGDGILDIWVEFGYAVAVISFQKGEFKEVFSSYMVPGLLHDAEYVDLDNDGIYEIKIPYSINVDGVPGAPDLPWVSFYEWDGTGYVLNNWKFYAKNDEYFIRLLSEYNYMLLRHGSIINLCETYKFYLGLVHYYRQGKVAFSSVANELIRHYDYGHGGMPSELQWILEHGQNEDYIQAIKSISKSPPPPE